MGAGPDEAARGEHWTALHGKPIICYSIETARKSGLFSRILVSTDDAEIAEIAKGMHVDVHDRPAALCEDDVGTQEVACRILERIDEGEYEYACVIYPTANRPWSDRWPRRSRSTTPI